MAKVTKIQPVAKTHPDHMLNSNIRLTTNDVRPRVRAYCDYTTNGDWVVIRDGVRRGRYDDPWHAARAANDERRALSLLPSL